jgi:uncharacterized hydrophobic protein (TIGR00271 family)
MLNIFSNLYETFAKKKQKKALDDFREEMFGFPIFFLLIILSSCIVSIGLLRNNQAVLIGAMLITPLVNPFTGISLGIVTRSWKVFKGSLLRAIFGVIIFWLISYGVSDLLINHSPDIIQYSLWDGSKFLVELPEILIAIFAGLIAAISIASEKIHALIAGAAIALAMAPPLAASGIGLAIGRNDVFINAMQLFLINALGLVVMGLFVFLIFGFRKKETEEALS